MSPSPTKTPARGSCLVFLMNPEMRVRPTVEGETLTVTGFDVSNTPSLATTVKLYVPISWGVGAISRVPLLESFPVGKGVCVSDLMAKLMGSPSGSVSVRDVIKTGAEAGNAAVVEGDRTADARI